MDTHLISLSEVEYAVYVMALNDRMQKLQNFDFSGLTDKSNIKALRQKNLKEVEILRGMLKKLSKGNINDLE